MSFDLPGVETYEWGADSTFGATSVLHYINGPRGKVGFVRDLMADVTTALVGTTTVPEIQVGISSGDVTYGRYRLGTAAGTGYAVGPYRASQELITGNPPRTLADFAGHVVLDGGPLTSAGISGGSYGTQVPKGRIPASGWTITNVVQGVDSSHCRIYAAGLYPLAPFKDLLTGMLVSAQGIAGGGTNANANLMAISAVDTNFLYIEVTKNFTGTYTSGGNLWLSHVVSLSAGTGGSPAGGGYARVQIEWVGASTP
jgi:hypothetical protein